MNYKFTRTAHWIVFFNNYEKKNSAMNYKFTRTFLSEQFFLKKKLV